MLADELRAVVHDGRSAFSDQGIPAASRIARSASMTNDEMKLAAAHAIAACVSRSELGPDYIIPSVFNRAVAPAVAEAVARAAHRTGAARRRRRVGLPRF